MNNHKHIWRKIDRMERSQQRLKKRIDKLVNDDQFSSTIISYVNEKMTANFLKTLTQNEQEIYLKHLEFTKFLQDRLYK